MVCKNSAPQQPILIAYRRMQTIPLERYRFVSGYDCLKPCLLLLLLLFSALLTPSLSATLPDCDHAFACGSLQNITYPFTGGARPAYCGPPEFQLTCVNNTHTELTTDSVTYRVLSINQTLKTLTLAPSEFYNTTCPAKFTNSTLDSTVFAYGDGNQDLTLSYGCSSQSQVYTFYNRFSCELSGFNSSDAFYLVGPVPVDPILQVIARCTVTVGLKLNGDAAGQLTGNQTTLREALMSGFNVSYSDPYEHQCSNCSWVGGRCGFDSNSSLPICICGDVQCAIPTITLSNDSGTSSSGKSQTPKNIVLFIAGAILAGVGLGWGIFACKQRRRKRLSAQSSLSAGLSAGTTKSKEISPPTMSKGLAMAPSTYFTRSIPSYPSSKFSDLENVSTYFGAQVFDYTELEEATGNFDRSRELGDGGFGTVYYGQLQDGRTVAVKRLYENNFKRVEQFMNEVEILTRLRHVNLVQLYGCTSKRSRELLLVYEYIPNGTVADHLHGRRANSGLLSWPVRLSVAVETAGALAYLHASDIIHRDVKTNNILLDNDFRVKVADFGLSRLFPTDVTHVSTAPQGTPGYVDPEYYQCYQLTEKSDVYSFGVVLIELISSKQAVDTNRDRHDINLSNMAVNKIQNHALHELVDPSLGFEANNSVRRMITLVAELAFRCLQTERDMRPSMGEVLEALRGIKNGSNAQKPEVVDIVIEDEVGLLKGGLPPTSPDSQKKWVRSNSSTPNSSG
ncbi:LEAF RUST 10 DISEASE-RESISTANCE LOCUS RECEPTOR-LIKE PROTEIN KINASE-like 1.4 isoform X1 [Rhododendron vialii]|uniref:LEAF RUST 10 DISEASE-RESISTANCE LOCUS RECEPTOR-LIKE PROTEIN KINASE-like 1.4 isoform X1 n=1 Tax=Rhododendron vialii TaxID=182163 RepID=UPI00265E8BDB|nr:LEAF RUST 10 DISEASE-RESISTANCE LOCUS RECEPTOR-LIKE PROTEIN KINASE-like 1.4 isoform X1 [Rhododendron vialii]